MRAQGGAGHGRGPLWVSLRHREVPIRPERALQRSQSCEVLAGAGSAFSCSVRTVVSCPFSPRSPRPADPRCSGCIAELPRSADGRLQRCLEGGLVGAPSRAPRGSRQVRRAGARGDPGREGGLGRGLGLGRGSRSPRGLRARRDPRPGTCFRGASGTLFAGLTRGGGDGEGRGEPCNGDAAAFERRPKASSPSLAFRPRSPSPGPRGESHGHGPRAPLALSASGDRPFSSGVQHLLRTLLSV